MLPISILRNPFVRTDSYVDQLLLDADALYHDKQFNNSILCFKQALDHCQFTNFQHNEVNLSKMAEISSRIGKIYNSQSHYVEAIEYHNKAYDFLYEIIKKGASKEIFLKSYDEILNIGDNLYGQKDFAKAKEKYIEGISLYEANIPASFANFLRFIAVGDIKKKEKDLLGAKIYYEKGLSLFSESNDWQNNHPLINEIINEINAIQQIYQISLENNNKHGQEIVISTLPANFSIQLSQNNLVKFNFDNINPNNRISAIEPNSDLTVNHKMRSKPDIPANYHEFTKSENNDEDNEAGKSLPSNEIDETEIMNQISRDAKEEFLPLGKSQEKLGSFVSSRFDILNVSQIDLFQAKNNKDSHEHELSQDEDSTQITQTNENELSKEKHLTTEKPETEEKNMDSDSPITTSSTPNGSIISEGTQSNHELPKQASLKIEIPESSAGVSNNEKKSPSGSPSKIKRVNFSSTLERINEHNEELVRR